MIENVVGASLGVKLVNGKIKPKFGVSAIISVVFMILLFLLFCVLFVFGLINLNIEYIFFPLVGILAFGYILLISPYLQKSSNYYIEFVNEQSLFGFKLFYKNKPLIIKYIVDNEGKIAFADNDNKLNCIFYADGSKMSNLTKYRIMNYFSKWLNDNNLLSNNVTTSFEKI